MQNSNFFRGKKSEKRRNRNIFQRENIDQKNFGWKDWIREIFRRETFDQRKLPEKIGRNDFFGGGGIRSEKFLGEKFYKMLSSEMIELNNLSAGNSFKKIFQGKIRSEFDQNKMNLMRYDVFITPIEIGYDHH